MMMERKRSVSKDPLIIPILSRTGNSYVYDACSNQIFRFPPALLHVLNAFRSRNKADLVDDLIHLNGMDRAAAAGSLRFIENLVSDYSCFFPSDSGPTPPYKPEFFRKEAGNVSQLILEVTQKCNFRCRYCGYSGNYRFSRRHTDRTMDFVTARKSIRHFKTQVQSGAGTRKRVSIGFYGGEPLLEFPLIRRCIPEIREAFSPDEAVIQVSTNGSLLSSETLRCLKDDDVQLYISLDGPACENDKNRVFSNGQGTFATVWRNVQRIMSEDPGFYESNVNFLITLSPNHDLLKIQNFFENHQFLAGKKPIVNSVYAHDSKADLTPPPLFQKQRRVLASLYKRQLRQGHMTHPFMELCFERDIANLRNMYYRPLGQFQKYTHSCFPGCQKVFVSADGTFHVCEKINSQFPIGDCDSGIDFEKAAGVWNRFQSEVCGECGRCISVQFCHVCLAVAAKNGRFDAGELCKTIRKRLPEVLREYIGIYESCSTTHAEFAK